MFSFKEWLYEEAKKQPVVHPKVRQWFSSLDKLKKDLESLNTVLKTKEKEKEAKVKEEEPEEPEEVSPEKKPEEKKPEIQAHVPSVKKSFDSFKKKLDLIKEKKPLKEKQPFPEKEKISNKDKIKAKEEKSDLIDKKRQFNIQKKERP